MTEQDSESAFLGLNLNRIYLLILDKLASLSFDFNLHIYFSLFI